MEKWKALYDAVDDLLVNNRDLGECFVDREHETYDPDDPEKMWPDWAAVQGAMDAIEEEDWKVVSEEQQRKYVEEGGVKCPRCGSLDIGGGTVEIDQGVAWQAMRCDECDLYWTDTYTLTGITDIDGEGGGEESGDGKEIE